MLLSKQHQQVVGRRAAVQSYVGCAGFSCILLNQPPRSIEQVCMSPALQHVQQSPCTPLPLLVRQSRCCQWQMCWIAAVQRPHQ